jgi:hypothetical protein
LGGDSSVEEEQSKEMKNDVIHLFLIRNYQTFTMAAFLFSSAKFSKRDFSKEALPFSMEQNKFNKFKQRKT